MSTTFVVRLAAFLLWAYPRLLGALLLFTGLQKIREPAGIRAVLRFDGIPEQFLDAAAWMVIAVEFLLGAVLILRPRRLALTSGIILLAIYIAQIAYLLIWHEAPNCACLEGVVEYENARRGNLLGLVRNICLFLAAWWTWIQLPAPRTSAGNSLQSAANGSSQ